MILNLDLHLIELKAAYDESGTAVRAEYERQRKCTATRADGKRCQAWAVWNADEQKCSSHLYSQRRTSTEMLTNPPPKRRRAAATCTCPAYNWPHRQGRGLCRHPDHPLSTCPTPAGKRRQRRSRSRLSF